MKHYSSSNYVRFSKVPYPKEYTNPIPNKPANLNSSFYLFTQLEKNKIITVDGQTIKLQIKDPREINFQAELQLLTQSILENQADAQQIYPLTKEQIKEQWLSFIQPLIDTYQIPLSQITAIKKYISYTIYDAENIASILKYQWDVARPIQLNSNLKIHSETPKYPTYPSNEAIILGTIEVILSCFFPTEIQTFQSLIKERLDVKKCSGLHFHCDIHEGFQLGKQLGDLIVSSHRLTSHRYHIPSFQKNKKSSYFFDSL
ncbi:MAG: hypothetical protein ACI35O_01280 [Bacillaceae bacterium]